jgi:hypothetical protein
MTLDNDMILTLADGVSAFYDSCQEDVEWARRVDRIEAMVFEKTGLVYDNGSFVQPWEVTQGWAWNHQKGKYEYTCQSDINGTWESWVMDIVFSPKNPVVLRTIRY